MTQAPDATISAARSPAFLFRGQLLHFGLVAVLAILAYALAAPALRKGLLQEFVGSETYWGLTDRGWFTLNIAVVVVHQLLVWLVFRGQLGWGVLTRWFGDRDLLVWGCVFLPFLVARPFAVYALAVVDAGSLALPRWLAILLGLTLLLPAVYAMGSVAVYFGIPRALGGDHFRVEYRQLPMVTGGAFAWTPNAMYLLVFLGLWSIALLVGSHAALVAALFQHAAIWAHYHGTERPDMLLIYRAGKKGTFRFSG